MQALPSKLIKDAAGDDEVFVRHIDTDRHGTWVAVINTSLHAKQNITVALPEGEVTDAVTGQPVRAVNGKIRLDMYPCQLRSFRVQ